MKIDRRQFLWQCGRSSLAAAGIATGLGVRERPAYAAPPYNVYVSKNGTPAQNVAKVIEMRYGGIQNLIGQTDVVVVNPNGQWPEQGGTNTACMMGLIDLILERPGGFSGEVVITENIHKDDLSVSNMWAVTPSQRNGPYNFLDMIQYYSDGGHANVTGVRLNDYKRDSYWKPVTGPSDGEGWVRDTYTATDGAHFYVAYPIFRSSYSGKYVNLKNGVWDGTYAGQPSLKFIKMPNLNNHGWSSEDYAGVTSAVKSFLGITEIENGTRGVFDDGTRNMHAYARGQFITGEVVGQWMLNCRVPDVFITTAEWVGYGSRTGSDAAQPKTVGLCDDPVTLDFHMCKHVLYPTHASYAWLDPDNEPGSNHTRLTLEGCASKGFGTLNETDIQSAVYDFDDPSTTRSDIDKAIKAFKEGTSTQEGVEQVIDDYMKGS